MLTSAGSFLCQLQFHTEKLQGLQDFFNKELTWQACSACGGENVPRQLDELIILNYDKM